MGTWAVAKCKHTYNEPGRDVTWTALVISVYSVWDVTWTAINALVISSDLCSVWQFHIFYIAMTCCHHVQCFFLTKAWHPHDHVWQQALSHSRATTGRRYSHIYCPSLADLGGHREHVNPPLTLNSVLMVSLPSVILYKHLLNSHRLVVVNPPFDFSRSAVTEICVPPDFLFPRTHIPGHAPGDICSPWWITVICVPPTRAWICVSPGYVFPSRVSSCTRWCTQSPVVSLSVKHGTSLVF